MKKYHFNSKNPFTVPEGYFDTLQDRIIACVQKEQHSTVKEHRVGRIVLFQTLAVAAACLAFIFVAVAVYLTYSDRQLTTIAESDATDDVFYQWILDSDRTTLLAESLDVSMPEQYSADNVALSEEDEAIICFLERDNINLVAIASIMANNSLYNN